VGVTASPYDLDIDSPTIPLYGLDIETDTTLDGLDPAVAGVVAVAVDGEHGAIVFDHPDEATLLRDLDAHLASLPPGVLCTWNGGAFDLPFLDQRAGINGVELGLTLTLDPTLPGHHDPLAGHEGAYRGSWFTHRHVDGYQVYRADVGARLGFPCGLKAMSRMVGLPSVDVDVARLHLLSRTQRRAYVTSDAHLARALVARRWPSASRAVDAAPPPSPTASLQSIGT